MQSLPRNMYQRDYSHSFNQEKCFLSNDIMDYWYVSQGKITVPSIDDREDMQFANEAFDVLGFTEVFLYLIDWMPSGITFYYSGGEVQRLQGKSTIIER